MLPRAILLSRTIRLMILREMNKCPQLLISVRDVTEARAALDGGCEILDVKEPARGSLGMADPDRISEIVALARSSSGSVDVSAALGDATDWIADRPTLKLPAGLRFVKLGTAGLREARGWESQWSAARAACVRSLPVEDGFAPGWIIVAYADWQLAGAPAPAEVLAAAARLSCAGLLIDTFSKGAAGLFSWISPLELTHLTDGAREAGLTFAVAGRLQRSDLSNLSAVPADIVGIRSAACRGGVRNAAVDAAEVRSFGNALRAAWDV